ncbi:MAG: hypothetical protein ACI837_002686 [Crocinitomicaceae bacterium]|jgi:hypothetical protein
MKTLNTIPLLFVLSLFCCPFIAKAQISYSDVATSLGLQHTSGADSGLGTGISFYDFNQDGWDDLTLGMLGDSIVFYQNTGSGFQQINSMVPYTGNSKQILWVDYDNDGYKDLYVAGDMTGNKLYRNDAGSLTDVTVAAGIPTDSMPTFGITFGDYDNDGFLDLYITNRVLYAATFSTYFYHNEGDGTFVDVTLAAGVSDSLKGPFGACFLDINHNGWSDLYVFEDETITYGLVLRT